MSCSVRYQQVGIGNILMNAENEDISEKKKVYSKEKIECTHVLVRISTTMKRHSDHGNSNKRKHLTGTWLQFRGLVHHCHGRKHDSM